MTTTVIVKAADKPVRVTFERNAGEVRQLVKPDTEHTFYVHSGDPKLTVEELTGDAAAEDDGSVEGKGAA